MTGDGVRRGDGAARGRRAAGGRARRPTGADGVPVRPGASYTVEALRLNDDGEGVAQVGGFTVFVPDLLPGERGEALVAQVERRFARARLVRRDAATASPLRTDPACAVFGACGGCQLQHLTYAAQLEHKRTVVVSALRRIGRFLEGEVPVLPTLGMTHPWRYRNHVQVPLRFEHQAGRYEPGFFAAGSHELVQTRHCQLAPLGLEALVQDTVDALNDATARDLPGLTPGLVHHLIVRQSWTNGEQMLVFAVRRAAEDALKAMLRSVLAGHPALVSVGMTVQPRPVGPPWGPEVVVLYGRDHLTEQVLGLRFRISPRSFFQVNTAQAEVLYRTGLEMADLRPDDTVLDAYCGTGTLTLLAAARVPRGRALGVEMVEAAVIDARQNADDNGIRNADFEIGAVEDVLPRYVAEGRRIDVVLLDPPRKGCDAAVLRAIAAARPRQVVYVSCNPATFARDARILVDAGYRLERVQPVDMFPQTAHVECVASMVLRRPGVST